MTGGLYLNPHFCIILFVVIKVDTGALIFSRTPVIITVMLLTLVTPFTETVTTKLCIKTIQTLF